MINFTLCQLNCAGDEKNSKNFKQRKIISSATIKID